MLFKDDISKIRTTSRLVHMKRNLKEMAPSQLKRRQRGYAQNFMEKSHARLRTVTRENNSHFEQLLKATKLLWHKK